MSVIIKSSLFKAKSFYSKFGDFTLLTRYASTTKKPLAQNIPEEEIKKSVFISQSTDIYTNLALEDWFYRNYDFSKHHILLLWKNDPCVVIGRHQNPWLECNVAGCEQKNILIARRNSGGGTVYHDPGNLNLSFFTPRERYNRKYNLEIITRALFRQWGLKAIINKKEDIIVQNEFKISGTAAKLGRPNAYHHCTLLVDAKKQDLSLALKKTETGITTNATQSVRSPVKNLSEVNSHIKIDHLLNAVGWEYLRTKAVTLQDGGHKLVEDQKGFQMINPTEDWFPGIDQLTEEFRSWDWTFGRSPKFTVTRVLEASVPDGGRHIIKLVVEVDKGIVQDVKMTLPMDDNQNASVMTNLLGKRYSHELTDSIVEATGCKVVAYDVKDDQSDVAAI
ncbi:lipoyltransferase 1, mitochondrial [Trichogramma pretiosum]|uniref:BPL/LPL catalytic domain-containing protein n=1 Tax=Trichogramma kaykai TaxID=54128 RepID=A0ABD2XD79_9HYME|nr:lipoyltransferase 1, mitochondrial [Trichogramma pretiosum]